MRKFVYPLQYDYLVRQYAYETKIDPALAASVILVESKFDERASSQPGAHGLMQVMPDTAQWIADEMGMTDYTPDKLSDVRTNIRLGTWYLAYLLKEYDGNQILALAAYNAGRGHVDSWVREYGWTKDFQEIEKIPFSETREYVRIVLLTKSTTSSFMIFKLCGCGGMADALSSGGSDLRSCGFNSRQPHHSLLWITH